MNWTRVPRRRTAKDVAAMCVELITGGDAPDDVFEGLLRQLKASGELSKASIRAMNLWALASTQGTLTRVEIVITISPEEVTFWSFPLASNPCAQGDYRVGFAPDPHTTMPLKPYKSPYRSIPRRHLIGTATRRNPLTTCLWFTLATRSVPIIFPPQGSQLTLTFPDCPILQTVL